MFQVVGLGKLRISKFIFFQHHVGESYFNHVSFMKKRHYARAHKSKDMNVQNTFRSTFELVYYLIEDVIIFFKLSCNCFVRKLITSL